jgi:autotransporter-associated beta strand protein
VLFCSLLLFTVALLPLSTHGASKFWTGAVNGNFATAGNWVGNVAPVAGDDLVFQTGVTRLLVTNNFSPNRAFNSLLFQGSNYFVRGNAILVTNGISSINPVGANHVDADVDVRASQPWEAQGALASLDINGDINLNANTLTVRANTGDFFFSGVISGSGNLVKTNVGTLRLDGGTGHNTYTGFTRFDGGVLELDKFAIIPSFTNFTAIPGDLTIGDGNGLVGTDVLRLLSDDQIADTSDVTVKNSGLFDLNDNSDRIASLTIQGGTVDSGTGLLTLGGNLTSLADANTATINGNLSLGGVSRTFDINVGPPAADMRINANISSGTALLSTAGFTKTGGGSLFLAGTNTYNGTTFVNDGQLALLSDRALGATTTVLGAAAPTVINGDANLFVSGVQVTNEDLTINSANPGGAFNASGASVWTGDILLNTDTFISSSGSFLLSGAITGSGGFTKLNGGSVTLGGTNANTYTGTTTVRDGTLLLDKNTTAVFDAAMSGPLVIGEDELPENADVVRFLRCCQLPDDTDVTINASGLLDLNGFGQNVRNIILNGGDIDTAAAGSILPTGNIIVNANTNSIAFIDGRLSVLSNPIINVTGHYLSPDVRINALVHGAGGFTKNGVGELSLNAANTFTGTVTVNDGSLQVDDSNALGGTANGTIVRSGAVLVLRFDSHVPAEPLTLAGTGQSIFGALSSSFGSNSWAGPITLSSNATIYVDAADFLNLSGAITGSFDVTKTGTGSLIFSGGSASSFDDMFVNAGTLVFAKTVANVAGPAELTIGDGSGTDIVRWDLDNQLADTAEIHIALSGRLDLNDMIDTVGAIDGRGIIDLGSGVLRAGADNDSSTFTGLIVGTGALFKLGTGVWTLTANNTYTGPTTVSAGTLIVDGSQPQSDVTVNGTASLGGIGVIGDLQVFGNLRPGASAGMLTCSNVAFAAASDYFVELNGPAAGTGYDQLNVRGTNQLGGSTLHVSVGFPPAEGDRFTIINNDGSEAIVGTFAGLPNGSVFTADGLQFRILYSDIFLNDVVLIVTNTALKATNVTVAAGNGNRAVDPNECNELLVPVRNSSAGLVSNVSGLLSTETPGVVVTQPFSQYPNIPASATRTNEMPFLFYTTPGFVCGTNIDFVLTVATATNGSFQVRFSIPSGSPGASQRFNNSTVQAIPDSPGGPLNSTIAVAGITTPIKRVQVLLHITHTTDSDLDISLIGPDGTTVVLSSDNGGTASDYGTDCSDTNRTTFSDSGLTAITSASAPFVGTFRPEQPLSAFNEKFGTDANGIWTLRIADDTPGGVGSLRCWSLIINGTACTPGDGPCETCDQSIVGTIAPGDLRQNNRLTRNGVTSTCAAIKPCPGEVVPAEGIIHYDAYTFTNVGAPACVTVTLTTPCNSTNSGDNFLHTAAYLGSYDPANKCVNYLGDIGNSPAPSDSYSFNVPSDSVFVVIVNEVDSGVGCTNYTLNVSGFDCPQRLEIEPLDANRVALKWSTSAVGYKLLSATDLNGPPPNFTPLAAIPVITGGKYIVTNTTSGAQRFYELRKP